MDLFKLVARSAAGNPNHPAVSHNGVVTSYRDLMQLQSALSRQVLERCPLPGKRIGVCIERSTRLVAGLLAVQRAGHTFVPMDPRLPEQRLAYLLEDSRPELVLTNRAFAGFLTPLGIPFLCVEDIPPESDLDLLPAPGNTEDVLRGAAYLIYTSGSTGEPKGVEISHAGICNQIAWRRDQFQITSSDRILQTFSLAFDPAIWEIFGTLQAGACMVISDETHDAAKIAHLILDEEITVVQTVPSMLRQLVQMDAMKSCSTLRHVICGGEALSRELVEEFYASCQGQLHNLYGPTEATIDATYWHCHAGEPESAVPIGRPIANTQVFLLGENSRIVASGDTGEIHIAGIGVASGYCGRPDLTSEKFVDPPDGLPADYGKLYRTGDIGRYRSDGAIEFLGRSDRQLKIRGFRIEPAEIEFALLDHRDVIEAAVTAEESKSGTPILVAYVALAPGASESAQDLRDFAASRLPAYAVPSTVIFLDALPRGVSNKIEYRALPKPDWDAPEHAETATDEPCSEVEQLTAQIWSRLLKVDEFDADANFFELGGDSLTLAQCIVELEETFNMQVSPGEFFTRSFRQISSMLEYHRETST